MGAPTGANQGLSPGGDNIAEDGGTNSFGAVRYYFRFNPKGTGTVTGIHGRFVTAVTYSATGLYLVQFATNFGAILGFSATIQSVSGGALNGFTAQLDNSLVNLAAGSPGATIGVALLSSAAYAAATGDTNSQVLCELVVSNNTAMEA